MPRAPGHPPPAAVGFPPASPRRGDRRRPPRESVTRRAGRWEFFWNSRRNHLGSARAEASRHPTRPPRSGRGGEARAAGAGKSRVLQPRAALWGAEARHWGCTSLATCRIPAEPPSGAVDGFNAASALRTGVRGAGEAGNLSRAGTLSPCRAKSICDQTAPERQQRQLGLWERQAAGPTSSSPRCRPPRYREPRSSRGQAHTGSGPRGWGSSARRARRGVGALRSSSASTGHEQTPLPPPASLPGAARFSPHRAELRQPGSGAGGWSPAGMALLVPGQS